MTDTTIAPAPLLRHAVFLTRGGDAGTSSPEVRLGQGAFLALRLVDLLGAEPPTGGDVFHYQWSATERYCRELAIDSPETSHLLAVVQSARDAFTENRIGLVTPALFAFAHYLEEESLYDEALDVLATLEAVAGSATSDAEAVATTLRVARVNRKLAKFEEAEMAYEIAGRRAELIGDRYSMLLSRIGRTSIMFDRGNLGEAELAYTAIAADARVAREADAEARAEHGIGAALALRGRTNKAIPHIWHAYELYDDASSKTRALSEVGHLLLELGDLDGAERALHQALGKCVAPDHTNSIVVELLDCSALRGDQVGFERWREEGHARESRMRPATQVDFYLKQGLGDHRFGRVRRAKQELDQALTLARAAGLHEAVFRIESDIERLHDANQVPVQAPVVVAEPDFDGALDFVRASLRALAEA